MAARKQTVKRPFLKVHEPTAAEYVAASMAENTRLAYKKDVARFLAWGGSLPSSPERVAEYISAHGDTHRPATITRWVAAITQAHAAIGCESPCRASLVSDTLRGIRRVQGAHQRRVAPAIKEELEVMVSNLPTGLLGLRNRALLLFGFAGAMRRSELVHIKVEDLRFDTRGVRVNLGKTKTDQTGEHSEVAIPKGKGPLCPVKAIKTWLTAAQITRGPLFRAVSKTEVVGKSALTPLTVARIVKSAAQGAGFDPSLYSGHSLRAGLATSAARERKPLHKIKQQTRHKSDVTLLKYIRDAELFDDNAADLL